MSTAGLSQERLDRIHDVMAGYVERGDVPGVVTLVSRRGEVYIEAIGRQAIGDSAPMRRDTIFRITSMTKPIIAVATMILVEECKLRLDEPVDRLLPELTNRQVLKQIDGPIDDTVPANRPITVHDLLTFRMGFGLIFAPADAFPILQAADELQLMIGPPQPRTPLAPDEWMRRLGTLPLMHQPGEQWMYNTASDVLGVLIARAAGQPLESFLRERIFKPLGMKDTGFSIPAVKLDWLAACYEVNPETRALVQVDGVEDSEWSRPPTFPAGRDGLVSTIDDYHSFGQMMLNKGKHGTERILSRLSVEAMTTNQLTSEQRAASDTIPLLLGNRGWGFGMAVITQRDDVAAVPGRFGWDGGYGTSWYSDPTEDMLGIVMTQVLAFPSKVILDFWTSAYQAIDD